MIKHELAEALRARGHDICYADADLNIWLWGTINGVMRTDQRHVAWVVSHPTEWLDFLCQRRNIGKLITHAYCASESLVSATAALGLPASSLVCPAPRRPDLDAVEPEFSVAFVGNSNPAKGRDMLRKVFKRHSSLVVGGGWGDLAQGTYLPWKDIAPNVNKALLYVHTCYPDMRKWGMMPDNVMDIAANTHALVLHDSKRAAEDLSLSGPTFENEAELLEKVAELLDRESMRREWEEAQRTDARKHCGYESAAESIAS
jgi:hypothetical protein